MSHLTNTVGVVTPSWSPVGVVETVEKKGILQTRKSRRIAAKGSEKRFFAPESNFVIDLVSDDVPHVVVDLTAVDDSTVINLTQDITTANTKTPIVDLTGDVEETANNQDGSKLSTPDDFFLVNVM
jgi:hypothetical protein